MKRLILLCFGMIVAGFAAYAIPKELPKEALKFEIQIEIPSVTAPTIMPSYQDNLQRSPEIPMLINKISTEELPAEKSEFTWQSRSESIWIQHYPAGAFKNGMDPVRQAYRRGGFDRLC